MPVKVVQFLAVVPTALALSPGMANGLALSRKLHRPQERYYAAQAIYRGWDLFPIVLVAALAANLPWR